MCGAAHGSGKSTTLAAMIDTRNCNEAGHIITIEDPIEFVHRHKQSIVTQREVGTDTHNFQTALKNTLRQAPDVILIGEIRDTETMEAAITFAETGHLCLGTLHSNNANQAIECIMNFFATERHAQNVSATGDELARIVSQRLIPTLDGKRVAALEILMDTPRIKELIKQGDVDTLKEAMEQGVQEGCQTFDQYSLPSIATAKLLWIWLWQMPIAQTTCASRSNLQVSRLTKSRLFPWAKLARPSHFRLLEDFVSQTLIVPQFCPQNPFGADSPIWASDRFHGGVFPWGRFLSLNFIPAVESLESSVTSLRVFQVPSPVHD